MTDPSDNLEIDSSSSLNPSDMNLPIVDAQVVSELREVIDAELAEPRHVDAQQEVVEAVESLQPTEVESPVVDLSVPPVLSIGDFEKTERQTSSVSHSQTPDSNHEDSSTTSDGETQHSWVFRFAFSLSRLASHLFGITSIIFLLAVAASIPIVQFLSFGYLLEVSGRLARKQKFSDAMIGLKKASQLGGIVLGTWLTLLPIRFVSGLWREAHLIDPASPQTTGMRIFQVILIGFAVLHIGSAWTCGGKLRYFFWPIVAPFSFGVWIVRRVAGAPFFRKLMSVTIGWISPHLVDDVCQAKPIGDWFVPAILFKRFRSGNIYVNMRDAVWDFTASLNLKHYFMMGLKGFVGSFAWIVIPTSLLTLAGFTNDGVALLGSLFGLMFAIPIFVLLPFLQAHFAKTGKLGSFLQVGEVFRNFGRAPVAHVFSLLMTLLLALPLFFLKIEQIPSELLWTLSIVFIMFSWPARMAVGWAYRRGSNREKPTRWWVRYPIMLFAAPIAFSFVLIMFFTRYISWHGALSLFENHVFLLPAPFWM